jgi:hypothetical protein
VVVEEVFLCQKELPDMDAEGVKRRSPVVHQLDLSDRAQGLPVMDVFFARPAVKGRNAGDLRPGGNENNLLALFHQGGDLFGEVFHESGIDGAVGLGERVRADLDDDLAGVGDNVGNHGRTCPSPSMQNFVVVSASSPIGPRACSFWVLMPSSAPMPNSPPSVNRVEAFT